MNKNKGVIYAIKKLRLDFSDEMIMLHHCYKINSCFKWSAKDLECLNQLTALEMASLLLELENGGN